MAGGVVVASFEGDFVFVAILGTDFSGSLVCFTDILLFEKWSSGSWLSVILFSCVVILFGLCT